MRAAKVGTLGVLCRKNHDFEGTGLTLRYKSGHCIECFKLAYSRRMEIEEKKEQRRVSDRRRKQENKKQIEARRRAIYAENKEEMRRKEAIKRERNRESIRAKAKEHKRKLRMNNAEECRAYARDYYAKNSLKIRVRNRVYKAIKQQKLQKIFPVHGYGIDVEAIAISLGKCPGQSKEWHIDHIRPLSSFDLSDPEQMLQAFAPSNHQWLPAKENLIKSNKYVAHCR